MQNISPKSTELQHQPQTTMLQLMTCTDDKTAFNMIVKIEQELTVAKSIERSPLIISEGPKKMVVKHLIKIVELFLKVTGKTLENFQLQIVAGDLYDQFRTDSIDDVILMFKMARNGEFGKIYGFDTMVMMEWVAKYKDHKAQEREKLWQKEKSRLQFSEGAKSEKTGKSFSELDAETQQKFTELEKRLSGVETKQRSTFSISRALQSMDGYLELLPETSQNLSDADLKYELMKAETTNKEAFEILSLELERRKAQGTKKKKKND